MLYTGASVHDLTPLGAFTNPGARSRASTVLIVVRIGSIYLTSKLVRHD